jgi:hypothetical protein
MQRIPAHHRRGFGLCGCQWPPHGHDDTCPWVATSDRIEAIYAAYVWFQAQSGRPVAAANVIDLRDFPRPRQAGE